MSSSRGRRQEQPIYRVGSRGEIVGVDVGVVLDGDGMGSATATMTCATRIPRGPARGWFFVAAPGVPVAGHAPPRGPYRAREPASLGPVCGCVCDDTRPRTPAVAPRRTGLP